MAHRVPLVALVAPKGHELTELAAALPPDQSSTVAVFNRGARRSVARAWIERSQFIAQLAANGPHGRAWRDYAAFVDDCYRNWLSVNDFGELGGCDTRGCDCGG